MSGADIHLSVDFCGEDDVVASPVGQCFADDLIRLALGVHVGGINEVDAGIQGSVDDLDRDVVIGLAPGAEHHCAKAKWAYLHAGTSKVAVVHRDSLGTAAGNQNGRRIESTAVQTKHSRTQEASAFCLSLSNSSWVMVPLSSRLFADAI